MGYSLRQPSNEGNACYDGFLGHPRKRGEHAACTPFQMHPQWGHESLHLQTGHPLIGGIQNGHPLTFLDRTTPAYCEESLGIPAFRVNPMYVGTCDPMGEA